MRLNVVKSKDGKKYIALPEDINTQYVEVFKLRDGFYLMTVPLENINRLDLLSQDEVNLLMKLSLMRYADRELSRVMSVLSQEERAILNNLLVNNVIFVKKSRGKEYIAFDDKTYEWLKRKNVKEESGHYSSKQEQPRVETRIEKSKEVPFFDFSKGYLIVKDQYAAASLAKKIAEGVLTNVKFFQAIDGYTYFASTKFLKEYGTKAINLFKKEKELSVDDLALKFDIPPDAALTILRFLSEESLIYELDAKRHIFKWVE